MNNPNLILGLVNIVGGVVLILFSLPLLTKQVKPNKFYGMCISKALASEENWYRINAFWARKLLIWSVMAVGCGIAFCFLEARLSVFTGLSPILLFIGMATVESLLFARGL